MALRRTATDAIQAQLLNLCLDSESVNLSGLLATIRAQSAYQTLLESQPEGGLGLQRSARPYVMAALATESIALQVIITSRVERAHDLAEQLLAWQPDLQVLSFPEPNPIFYERAQWGPRTIRARLHALSEAHAPSQPHTVIVTSARALMQRTLPLATFAAHSQSIAVGDRLRLDKLLHDLLAIGYQPETIVTESGIFSRRGGIVDVFPVASVAPVRVEFFGDEIDSLRNFDPATQRSGQRINSIHITPAREALPYLTPPLADRLDGWFAAQRAALDPSHGDDPALPLSDQSKLAQGTPFPTLEFYLPQLYDEAASLLDYLPADARIVVEDMDELHSAIEELETQALALRQTNQQDQQYTALPPDYPLPYVTWDYIAEHISGENPALELGGLLASEEHSAEVGSLFAPEQRHGGQLKSVLEYLSTSTRNRETVVVVSRQAQRLAELWAENNIGAPITISTEVQEVPSSGNPLFVTGALTEGWQLRAEGGTVTRLLTDAEIFGWRRPEPRRRSQPRAIAPEDFFSDLAPGDYVVHVDYGIGRFAGLERVTMKGVEREYLLVSYYGNDSLYVPIHQADRLTRYVGVDDNPPPLNHLGTSEWNRLRESTRESILETAREMLQLYAARETVPGHAYSPDTPWQHELEASFPYLETEDQLIALQEVKADMQKPRPMDRLICGDVGYGKTEVALRAAFKAVMDGKQAALLVPTTVLAQQHYNTFSQRLAPFPVAVEMLSRFRTRSQQQAVLSGMRQGTVDIVIGTHRLLQDDIAFKDLGLLIVDEEQRFGVTHKDKLKSMRTELDVLTLTATPIPRTLYMSLAGARDISIINTAPEERLPVVTHIGQRDDDLIRRAILREVERGGQVFYVHNRVQTIATEHARLTRLLPDLTIAIGHGQMPEAQLAEVMTTFNRGQIDVLVSTSIIESGLDIPNANTLIVDRADRFGLAQLYQLRGRVGRSTARAYAYFFHPRTSRLTPDARARLETMAEQTELGAGMSIAMRDLELRGAGDILGKRQHGNIAVVGFHLYTRMLNQAVKTLREQGGIDPLPESLTSDNGEEPGLITIDLPIPTYLPTDYIPQTGLRLKLYRRLADLTTEQDIADMAAELKDRFGPPPPPVENLLFQLSVKSLGLRAGIESITTESGQLRLRLPGLHRLSADQRPALQHSLGHEVRISNTGLWLPVSQHQKQWQAALLEILDSLPHQSLLHSVKI